MLSVAAQTALVETLLRPSSPHLTELDGHTPDLSDVLCVKNTKLTPNRSQIDPKSTPNRFKIDPNVVFINLTAAGGRYSGLGRTPSR